MAERTVCLLALAFTVTNAFFLDSMSTLLGGSTGSHTSASSSVTKLGSYNVNTSQMSVSGISAGGAMAVQFHVAYSKSIMGVGSIAGIVYHCSQGQLATALTTCMTSPSGIYPSSLSNYASNQANGGAIDATSHMADDKVFIWTGTNDRTVNPQSADKIKEFYTEFVANSNIKLIKENGAAHTFPTDNYGNPCSMSSSPYISNCNYNGAYELLNFIYGGNLIKPTTSTQENGQFITFDQTEFLNARRRRLLLDNVNGYVQSVLNTFLPGGKGSTNIWQNLLPGSGSLPALGGGLPTVGGGLPGLGGSLPGLGGTGGTSDIDSQGFAYIPSGCTDKSNVCKLHVAFHGCKQGRNAVGDAFAKHAGYNKVGELNNIIMLYPQVTASMVSNPNGCFDWWGYSGANFDTKGGVQMKTVKKMIDRLSGV